MSNIYINISNLRNKNSCFEYFLRLNSIFIKYKLPKNSLNLIKTNLKCNSNSKEELERN